MVLGEHGSKDYEVDIDNLLLEQAHETLIFPTASNRKVVFTAGTPANTWSAWAEIQDDDTPPVTLSSLITSNIHVSALSIEDLSHKDKMYMVEISHGNAGSKAVCCRHRFRTGDVTHKLAAIAFARIRSHHVNNGETMYYRMMSEQAGGTCDVSIRWHLHP